MMIIILIYIYIYYTYIYIYRERERYTCMYTIRSTSCVAGPGLDAADLPRVSQPPQDGMDGLRGRLSLRYDYYYYD